MTAPSLGNLQMYCLQKSSYLPVIKQSNLVVLFKTHCCATIAIFCTTMRVSAMKGLAQLVLLSTLSLAVLSDGSADRRVYGYPYTSKKC